MLQKGVTMIPNHITLICQVLDITIITKQPLDIRIYYTWWNFLLRNPRFGVKSFPHRFRCCTLNHQFGVRRTGPYMAGQTLVHDRWTYTKITYTPSTHHQYYESRPRPGNIPTQLHLITVVLAPTRNHTHHQTHFTRFHKRG